MRRLAAAPLLHFVAIGVLLFAARGWWNGRAAREQIVVSAADVARLREAWTREHGVRPDAEAERGLLSAAIDEEVLFREALALGLDREDGAVRERLVRLGGFVGEDTDGEEALVAEARRLGLDRSDLVIRRHLVQMMRLATERVGAAGQPSEAELADYLARHAERFATPSRVTLAHVYLSRRRGAELESQATALLARLRTNALSPAQAASLGDPFIRGAEIRGASAVDLEESFGAGFADALRDAPEGEWVGPVPSSYGLHLVWIRARIPGGVPPLAAVRSQVALRLLHERGAARARERMETLRARYDVVVEAAPIAR
jgi:hypothetical protein